MKSNNAPCGCCDGVKVVTPEATANRPGLSMLSYRVGSHGSFLSSMLARLSSADFPKLAELTTRESNDFSIALLDAWATVADVLTFYQERIINEGYLRTATERRSVLELARLVGYKLKPGVSSSVYLAYTLDENFKEETVIPKAAKSQSIPGPNELPQTFETSEELKTRAQWNNLKPRMHRPQTYFSMLLDPKGPRVYLKGINSNLKPNDPLLVDFGKDGDPTFTRVKEVIADPAADRTLVLFRTESRPIQNGFLGIFQNDSTPQLKLILFDDGNGLPGFFSFRSFDANSIAVVSANDGSSWRVEVDENKGGTTLILMGDNGKKTKYKYMGVELITHDFELITHDFISNSYLRIQIEIVQTYSEIISSLSLGPSVQPRNQLSLTKDLKEQFTGLSLVEKDKQESATDSVAESVNLRSTTPINPNGSVSGLTVVSDSSNAILKRMVPSLSDNFAIANANADVTSANPIKVYALRARASMFGHNAPDAPNYGTRDNTGFVTIIDYRPTVPANVWAPPLTEEAWVKKVSSEGMETIAVDIQLDQVVNGSWLVIDRPKFFTKDAPNISSGRSVSIHKIENNQIVTRSVQGLQSKVSTLTIAGPWLNSLEENKEVSIRNLLKSSTTLLRDTAVYAQSEELELTNEPLNNFICGGSDDLIELDGYYEDLQAGRWAFVSGERADVGATNGVNSSELAMISVVKQDISRIGSNILGNQGMQVKPIPLQGDKIHTFIKLAKPLQYCFKRDTVKIYGNVVKATHGDTRNEVLGSGNGATALQSFDLKQPPLTYISAVNPSGIDSTLKVYVNNVQWHETDTLAGLAPTNRNFVTKTDDNGKTTIVFGNGQEGARLPTGIENIKAEYRNGIGKSGNVKAKQISLLTTRPLGVKEVINPLPASGGADKESRDQARKNTPLAVKALDRLVSVQDYQDFARVFAGVGKARAVEISDGRRQLVHVTIAGADDIPIDKSSDLYRNLRQSLLDFGDPYQAIRLEIRELLLIVIQANISILPDYLWEPVVTQVRNVTLDVFSFERRELGQDVLLSEVISVMQAVPGVAYVDVDLLRGIPEKLVDDLGERRLITPSEVAGLVSQTLTDENNNGIKEPLARIPVNLADWEHKSLRPAQIAFLTPDVPATLILNQINR
ncbi:putative baseplate assembly protein [Methylomonas sp. MgM2]